MDGVVFAAVKVAEWNFMLPFEKYEVPLHGTN
jgi:hypothetical protein